jgi:hypothetical protein
MNDYDFSTLNDKEFENLITNLIKYEKLFVSKYKLYLPMKEELRADVLGVIG